MLREFLRHLSLELNRSSLTLKAYETDLLGFNDFMIKSGVPQGDAGFFVPSAVTSADVREWMMTLSEEGLSPTSIRRKIQSLRAFFKFLMKKGEIASNPAALVPLPKTSRRLPEIATHSDIKKSLASTDSLRDSLIIELLYGCGLRRSELAGISDSDINPYTSELKILGKGNKHRIIPLPAALLSSISDWQKKRDALYPELEENPRPLLATSRGRMSVPTIYSIVRRALQSSGASRKSPHTLRHSFATQLLNSGADINSVKNLLGHSSLGATQIYTHVALSELKEQWGKAHPRAKNKTPDTPDA